MGLIVKSWLHTYLPKLLGWGQLPAAKVKNMIKAICLKKGYTSKEFRKCVVAASPHYFPVRWSPEGIGIFSQAHSGLATTFCKITCARKPAKPVPGGKYAIMEKAITDKHQELVAGMRKAAGSFIFPTFVFFRNIRFFSQVEDSFFRTSSPHSELWSQNLREIVYDIGEEIFEETLA